MQHTRLLASIGTITYFIACFVDIQPLFDVTCQLLRARHDALGFLNHLLVHRGSLGPHDHVTLKATSKRILIITCYMEWFSNEFGETKLDVVIQPITRDADEKKKKPKHNRSKLLPNSRAVKTTARLQEVLVSLSISYLKNLAPDILASHSA